MPRTSKKPERAGKQRPAARNGTTSQPAALPEAEVLTLPETAAYLRIPQEQVVRLVGPEGLPGRLIGSEWRFLKSAVQEWLRELPKPSSKEALMSLAGCWKDDPTVEEMLKEIYKQRGRPMTEDEE